MITYYPLSKIAGYIPSFMASFLLPSLYSVHVPYSNRNFGIHPNVRHPQPSTVVVIIDFAWSQQP